MKPYLITVSELKYKSAYTHKADIGDNPKYIHEGNKFDKDESYEVRDFINRISKDLNLSTLTECHKVEEIIKTLLPRSFSQNREKGIEFVKSIYLHNRIVVAAASTGIKA